MRNRWLQGLLLGFALSASLGGSFAYVRAVTAAPPPDPYSGAPVNRADPPGRWVTVVPSNSTNFAVTTRCIWVGGAGDMSFVDTLGNTRVMVGIQAGTQISIACTRVNTASTCTSMLAGY